MTLSSEYFSTTKAYRLGVSAAIITAVLSVWTTIVRDDGNGAGHFLVILAVGVGGYAARFSADGMARTMLGVAAMQAMFGLAVATAPITAAAPDGVARAIISNGVATALWLVSAACFRSAAAKKHTIDA